MARKNQPNFSYLPQSQELIDYETRIHQSNPQATQDSRQDERAGVPMVEAETATVLVRTRLATRGHLRELKARTTM